jgi:riboflavin kinase/FMN adenylyltransferase
MRIHRRFAAPVSPERGISVAIGNFDGLHKGHRAVIEAAREAARAQDLALGVVTFEPHPREVLAPEQAPARLTPFRRKAELLAGLGVEHCFVLPFGPALMRLPARRFVEEVLVGRIGARAVAAGDGFRFGHRRGGDMALMAALGRELGFTVQVVPAVEVAGETCSSTRIRELLQKGEVAAAAAMLGVPYTVTGTVRPGDRRGRELGFPTANVAPISARALLPATGVYVVRAGLAGGDRGCAAHPAVANLGTSPTFGGTELRLEVHLLDGEHALYGRRLEVAFITRLRDEERYASADALIAQMHRDCSAARRVHAALPA